MQNGTLDDALESGRGFGVLAILYRERGKVLIDILGQRGAQGVEIDVAGAHDLRGIGIVNQGKQEVLQSGVLVVALAGEPYGAMEGLF
jgi:hypothetical protein